VLLPRGYHPVVAAAGYELHYVWAIAGPAGREWRMERRPGSRLDPSAGTWTVKSASRCDADR
ncbi:MAG TPA: 5-deoxy-glucuronate isomerase, partial [bacterium]|nr:5-deoxy-glucuronate isomerase [bacterium]